MATRGNLTYEDYDGEKSNSGFHLPNLTAVNYAAVTQDLDEIKDAVLLVTLCAVRDVTITQSFPESAAAVSDPDAQRETKWLVSYRDTQQFLDPGPNTVPNPGYLKNFTLEIPGAKLSLLTANTQFMNIASGDGATFKTALEANMKSPYGGTIAINEVTHVGRST